MNGDSSFFCYRDGVLVPVTDTDSPDVHLEAADSWLVDEGRVRAIERHFARFRNAVSTICPDQVEQLPDFYRAVTRSIPRTGRWFPRIEFHGKPSTANHLHLRLREAPEQLDTVTLWTLDEIDPRVNPSIKGPDLSLGQQLRRRANLHGAEEAVLVNEDGYVVEGALSSLVWWRDGVLCAPGEDVRWLPSVTRDIVFSIASQANIPVREELVKPEQLNGREIWALSSLHGIRVVTGWDALPDGPAAPEHADSFRRRLRMLLTALD